MKGIELKIARLRAGMRQYELAQKLGITQQYLSMVENERAEFTQEIKVKLLEILKQKEK